MNPTLPADMTFMTLLDLARARARSDAQRPAYIFLEGNGSEGATLTYSQLDRRARAIAAYMHSLGAPGQRVLLQHPPGLDYIVGFLGCLYAGNVAVPAHPPGQKRNLHRLQSIVADAGPTIVLGDATAESRLARQFASIPELKSACYLRTEEIGDEHAEHWREPALTGDSLAFLQYTSGSTSEPRGVMVTHANLLYNQRLIQNAFETSESSVIVSWLPLFHDMGLIGAIMQPLYAGAKCVLMPPSSFLQRPVQWLDAISRYKATTSGGPNFAYELCLRRISDDEMEGLDLRSWTAAFSGAEMVRAETIERFARKFAACGFRKEAFYPCYGLAEATLMVSGGKVGEPPQVLNVTAKSLRGSQIELAEANEAARPLVSCGRSLGDQEVVIVDPDSERPCPQGHIGEIWICGPSVAAGYWNRQKKTDEIFNARSFGLDGKKFLRSGDLGILWNGELYVVGRRKEMMILRGENYYPEDIEDTLRKCHPVLNGEINAVFSVEVGGEERMIAVHEHAVGRETVDTEAIFAAMRAAIAEDHGVMLHAAILVRRGAIQRTTSGKIQRAQCRNLYLNDEWGCTAKKIWPDDEVSAPEPAVQVADLLKLPLEQRLQAIESDLKRQARQILGLVNGALETEVPLVRMGFDSVRAADLAAYVERAWGARLNVVDLLEDWTLRIVVRFVAEHLAAPSHQIPRIDVSPDDHLMLSWEQERLWLADQISPGSSAFNLQSGYRIRGPLDVKALELSVKTILQRHDVLHAAFGSVEFFPFQTFQRSGDIALSRLTSDETAATAAEEIITSLVRAESEYSFDLARGKLFRIVLLKMHDLDHVLLLTIHHIISDAWSLRIFERELSLVYAYNTGASSQQLSEPQIRFTDFVVWQRQTPISEKQIAYWQEQMAGAPDIRLPVNSRMPATYSSKPERNHFSFQIAPEMAAALQAIAHSQHATLFMVLLCAFRILLGRFCNQQDITVGVPIKARPDPSLEDVIGFFAYPLPIRTRLEGTLTFLDFLAEVRHRVLGAYANQAVPFAKIAQIMRSGGSGSSAAVLPVMFSYLAGPEQGLQLAACDVEPVDVPIGTADCDLFLTLTRSHDGIRGCLAYNHLLFGGDTAVQIVESYLDILRSIEAKPEVFVSELALNDELQQKAAVQSQARRELHIAASFVAESLQPVLEFWVEECGIPAVIEFAPYNQIFQQLLDKSGSSLCKSSGVNIILLRASDLITQESTLSDVEKSAGELARALLDAVERTSAYWLLCVCPEGLETENSRYWEKSLLEKVAGSPAIEEVGSDEVLRSVALKDYIDFHREKIAAIPYTEEFFVALGTLLMRKICMMENLFSVKAIMLDCDNTLWQGICGEDGVDGIRIGSEFRELQRVMVAQQQAGAILCLCSKNNEEDVKAVFSHHQDMPLRYEQLARTRINWRPKSENIRELAEELQIGLDSFLFLDDDQIECAEVQNALTEVTTLQLPCETACIPEFLRRIWALDRPRTTREGSVRTEFYKDELSRRSLQKQCLTMEEFLLSLNMQIDISTPGLEDIPRIAELTVRTNQFNTCKSPRSEAEVSRILQSGQYEFRVTRVKDRFGDYGLVGVALFRSGAQELEVETLLLSCRALGRRVERQMMADLAQIASQRGLAQIVMRLAPTAKNRPALEFLRSLPDVQVRKEASSSILAFHVNVSDIQNLSYQPVGTLAEAPKITSLPAASRKSVGISKSRLAARIAHDLTTVERIMEAMKKRKIQRFVPGKSRVPPSTWLEGQIVEIFEDVLGVQSIGVTDSFFELGGHSLLATQILSRLRTAMNADLPMAALFEAVTPRQLAELVQQKRNEQSPIDAPLTARPRNGPQPLSFAQERLWFLDQLHRGSAFYNVNAAVQLTGDMDVPALQQVFLALVKRHEALRTRFVQVNGKPMQVFDSEEKVRLLCQDLAGLSEPEKEKELQKRIQAIAHSPYDLAEGPLVRILLLRTASDQHVLVMGMHQIVSDGWSMEVLVRELTTLYSAFRSRGPSPLPPPVIQYADFALWQRKWLQAEGYKQQLQYWSNQLRALPTLNLPVDYARPEIQTFEGEHYSFIVSKDAADKLKQAGQQHQATLFMVLLAIWEVLLQRYSSQHDIVLGTPIANRNRIETEAVVGFFVNTLVLRTDLSGSPTFIEVLRRITKTTLEAYAHQDLPFEKLVAELQPERDRSRGALFQVLFEFHEAPDKALQMPGLEVQVLPVFSPSSRFDLSLNIVDQEWLDFTFEYNVDLFAPERIERMARHFEILTENLTSNFELTLSQANALLDRFDGDRNAISEAAYKSAVKDRFSRHIRRAQRPTTTV
jgi:FkbH-like protein